MPDSSMPSSDSPVTSFRLASAPKVPCGSNICVFTDDASGSYAMPSATLTLSISAARKPGEVVRVFRMQGGSLLTPPYFDLDPEGGEKQRTLTAEELFAGASPEREVSLMTLSGAPEELPESPFVGNPESYSLVAVSTTTTTE